MQHTGCVQIARGPATIVAKPNIRIDTEIAKPNQTLYDTKAIDEVYAHFYNEDRCQNGNMQSNSLI